MTLEEEIKQRIKRRIEDRMARRRGGGGFGGRPAWGGLLVLIGTLMLLDHLGILHVGEWWRYWPLLIIFAGLSRFFGGGQRAWGAFIVVAGILLQLETLGVTHLRWDEIWPVVIILAGIFLIWGSFEARRALPNWGNGGTDPRTTLNEHVIFGGVEKRVNSKNFKGGQLDTLFGGIEIDLRDAEMDGDEAVLVANAVFGGIEIRVPETWFVAAHGQGIFGGFTDATRYRGVDDATNPQKKTLIVRGTSIFGGVEIRN